MKVAQVPPESWSRDLAEDWDRLLLESEGGTIFQSFPWVDSWWRHFGAGRRPKLLTVRDEGGALCGLAPLYVRPLRVLGLPGPPVLGFMGDEGVGSEYLGFILRRDRQDETLEALGSALEGAWAVADFQGLREDSAAAMALPSALGGVPGRSHVERHPCSMIPLLSDYEAYLAALPQKFRTTLRYRTNKLTKNFAVKLIRTQEEVEIRPHLDRLFEMHQARWVAEGHPGSFQSGAKRAFYADVSAGFLRRGWLRFFHLEVDGAIRASQFGFAFRGVLHSLQEAFDHAFNPPGVGGVGVVLRGMALRECFAEGLRGYDFLGGVEEFKTRWGTETHYVRRVRVGGPGAAGSLAYLLTAGKRRFKDWSRERSPAWLLGAREQIRAWRRARRARPASSKAGGAGG